jgi:ketosteroid isomerase-like protein
MTCGDGGITFQEILRFPMRVLLCVAALVAATLIGAAQPAAAFSVQSSGIDLARAKAELLAVSGKAEARARSGHFIEAFSELFDSSGIYISPPVPVRGPAAIRAALTSDTLYSGPVAKWTVLHHGVSADGRDGFTYGYFDVVRQKGDSFPGRYHAYWRRDKRGQWRLLAFSRGRRQSGPLTQEVPAEVRRGSDDVRVYPMRDSSASLREVFATERTFAESAAVDAGRAFQFFAAAYAGKFRGPSEFVFGRDGIATIFKGAPPGAGPAWEPEEGSVASSNDLAFTFGPAWPRQAPKPANIVGKYFTIWKRQADGTWRYVVD